MLRLWGAYPNAQVFCRESGLTKMEAGLLCYDAYKRKSLNEKIDEALARYEDRFGSSPTACHVNPTEVSRHPRLRVVANKHIRPSHLWLGVDDTEED